MPSKIKRSILEIIEGVKDAQELYWAQIKVDIFRHSASSKSVKRWEEALARKRKDFNVIDPYDYPWYHE